MTLHSAYPGESRKQKQREAPVLRARGSGPERGRWQVAGEPPSVSLTPGDAAAASQAGMLKKTSASGKPDRQGGKHRLSMEPGSGREAGQGWGSWRAGQ